MMRTLMLSSFFLFTLFSSCKKDQSELDAQIITDYIASYQLDAQEKENGLYIVVEEEGNGVFPTLDSEVTVQYKGYLSNDKVFDQTDGSPVTFPLNAVIQGWQIGLPYFSEGGSGKLLIPSELGYGSQKAGDIPANSVLIFDIQLDSVH
jgi:FKBP-type peptidyl-prolyl cis-trans isomerase FkpA